MWMAAGSRAKNLILVLVLETKHQGRRRKFPSLSKRCLVGFVTANIVYETEFRAHRLFARVASGLHFRCHHRSAAKIFRDHAARMVRATGRFRDGATRRFTGVEAGWESQMGLHRRAVHARAAQAERG